MCGPGRRAPAAGAEPEPDRQREHHRVQLESRPDAEREGRDNQRAGPADRPGPPSPVGRRPAIGPVVGHLTAGPTGRRPTAAPAGRRPAARPQQRPERHHRRAHGEQVPVVEGVEHQRWGQREPPGAQAGQPGQQRGGDQPGDPQQHRGPPQEVPVGGRRRGRQVDRHAGQHRVLQHAAVQLLRPRAVPAVHVREDMPIDVPTDPEVLDVGVADVPGDADTVVRFAAALAVE